METEIPSQNVMKSDIEIELVNKKAIILASPDLEGSFGVSKLKNIVNKKSTEINLDKKNLHWVLKNLT